MLDGYPDYSEYPAVTCSYAGGKLDRIRVRQPVVFGDDRGPGEDAQWVGWRAVVQYSDDLSVWSFYRQSPLVKMRASDKYPADFLPTTIDLPGSVADHGAYRVQYRFFWYYPNKGTLDGRARHVPYWITLRYGSITDLSDGYCYPLVKALTTAGMTTGPGYGPHEPKFGAHWILDSIDAEYPAVTCTYEGEQDLVRMTIRRPIVFARDRSRGVDRQRVGWRAVIQWTDNILPVTWHTYRRTSMSRDQASDRQWADFLPKAVAFPASVTDHAYYRVVYELFWYAPGGTTVTGRALHLPGRYWTPVGPGYLQEAVCISNWSA